MDDSGWGLARQSPGNTDGFAGFYLPASSAYTHGHDEVLVHFSPFLVRINHGCQVVIRHQGRVNKDEWVFSVQDLRIERT